MTEKPYKTENALCTCHQQARSDLHLSLQSIIESARNVLNLTHQITIEDPEINRALSDLYHIINLANKSIIGVEKNIFQQILDLIGNIDHTKGIGPNAARIRGQMLNDIRDIVKQEISK